jgi:hypothetical protein
MECRALAACGNRCMFAAFLLAPAPFAATRYVSPTGADVTSTGPTFWQLEFNSCCDQGKPCKTIYWAVKMAQNGDVISVAEGHYVETITVSKNLLFKGAGGYLVGAPLIWVDGNKQDSVFKIELGATATIQSMLISNGKNGISNAGSLAMEECLVGGSERTESGPAGYKIQPHCKDVASRWIVSSCYVWE